MSKRIVIFTTFSEISPAYSLNRIVQDQLKMLLTHGYEPTVIVAESFEPEGIYADPKVTLKRIPLVPVHNEVKKDETFDEDVAKLKQSLEEVLKDADVVITHDIVYQPACLKHNIAARQIADGLPNLLWLHWIHSATSPMTLTNLKPYFSEVYVNLVSKPFPNSKYVFFNDYSIPRIANNFNVPESNVRVVHHPSDLGAVFGLTKAVEGFSHDKDLFSADAIAIYPIRLDRGKQVEMVVKTMACLKEFDLKVKCIIVDFHSTGGDKVTYRNELKNIGIDWGLNQDELIFTSDAREEWEVEVPYEDLMGLFRLANVFIMPSRSESYSLITQEAGLNKCVVVLNQDFAPFRDIFGANAIYRQYSANIGFNGQDGNVNTEYGPGDAYPEERATYEKNYHKDTAGMILSQLKNNKNLALSIFLRKYRNLDFVFKHELEPLFMEKV